MFDTLKYSKRLVEAGFTPTQAEVLAEEQAGLIDDKLATKRDLKELEVASKHDLKELEVALKHDLKELEGALKHDIAEVRHDMKKLDVTLRHDIAETKADILKWVAGLLLAQAAVIAALVKLL